MSKDYKRKNYFIDKQFQTKFILTFASVVLISSACVVILLLVLLQGSNTVAIENTMVTVKKTADFILPITMQTVIIVSVFSGIAVIVLSMLASHKISGPLFRLINDIDRVKDGDFNVSFKIRGDDQLQSLAQQLRDMVRYIKEDKGKTRKLYDELLGYLEAKDYVLSPDDKEDVKKILGSIKGNL